MLKPLFGEIQDRLPACAVNQRCKEMPLVQARYGEDAGIAGGVALCFDAAENDEQIERTLGRWETPLSEPKELTT